MGACEQSLSSYSYSSSNDKLAGETMDYSMAVDGLLKKAGIG